MPIFMSDEIENLKTRAEQISFRLGHYYMGCEHIFLATLDNESWLAEELSREGADAESVRAEILEIAGSGDEEPLWKGLITTPRLKRVLKLAENEAEEQRAFRIYPNHLISAICREGKSVPARALVNRGIDLISFRRNLLNLEFYGGKPVSSPQPAAKGGYQYPPPGTPHSAFLASKKSDGQDKNAPKMEKPKKNAKTPTLDSMGRDLVELAKSGKVDPIVGRKEEIRRVLQTLTKKMKNNPIIIGEAGVGKTAVIYGLAERIASGRVPDPIKDKRIIEVGMSSIIAGTKHRGEFEEKMEKIIKELMDNPDVILFIDEIHTIMGAGDSRSGVNAGNILKPHLARGDITIIGATTTDEYRKTIEKDPALERRFQPIFVEEPSEEETIEILKGLKEKYEKHHGVTFSPKAIIQAVKMSVRYIPDRNLPDKAIDLIDEAAAKSTMKFVSMGDEEAMEKVREEKNAISEVTEEEIAEVVSLWTGIPANTLTQDESERLLHMEDALRMRVVGQDEVVAVIAQTVRMSRMGLSSPNKPSGVFLFLGPTGVGKTEMAKALAEFLFNSEKELIRLDMSEYMEKHATSRMIGSPPGYVGHEEEGQLTKQVRTKPYSVVLLDEIEKAHPEVFDLFLQVFDDGRLTDSKGRTVNFTNTILILTSNIGTGNITVPGEKKTLNTSDPAIREIIMTELRQHFRPEFLNRIDEILIFNSLSEDALKNIVGINLNLLIDQLYDQREVRLAVDETAYAFLLKEGYDPAYGARPMKRAIQNHLAKPLAKELLAQGAQPGDTIFVTSDGDRLIFSRGESPDNFDDFSDHDNYDKEEDTSYPGGDTEHRTFGDIPIHNIPQSKPPAAPANGEDGRSYEPKRNVQFGKAGIQSSGQPPQPPPDSLRPERPRRTGDDTHRPQKPEVDYKRIPFEPKKINQERDNKQEIPDEFRNYPIPKKPILKQRDKNQNIQGIMPMIGPRTDPRGAGPGMPDGEDFENTKPRF